jgi:hypothetical protein
VKGWAFGQSGGGDWEDQGSGPPLAKSWWAPILTNKLGMVEPMCNPRYTGGKCRKTAVWVSEPGPGQKCKTLSKNN